MNVNLLIDAIVRQTTILVAQLATAAGIRSPLAHIANQIFMDLVNELKQQGLGNKVIADMFALSLRAYQNKVRRLSESNTVRGKTLWEAVYSYIQQPGAVTRIDALKRFRNDEEALVRGVLRDLVESGLVFQSGVGENVIYRIAKPDEVATNQEASGEVEAHLVWVAINRYKPATLQEIREAVPLDEKTLQAAIQRLTRGNRIRSIQDDQQERYTCDDCLIPIGADLGWEAAVLDHYQAMVTAICTKLRKGLTRAQPGESIGGSTYSFNVWDEHPLQQEVFGLLQSFRERAQDLRYRVDQYNHNHQASENSKQTVFTYVGQTVIEQKEREEE